MRQKARQKARIDANQPAIVAAVRKLGGSFQHTYQIPGALDGIIGYRGVDVRVEIKDPEKPKSERRLTRAEQDVFDLWKGRRPEVIETVDDIRALFKKIDDEKPLYNPLRV